MIEIKIFGTDAFTLLSSQQRKNHDVSVARYEKRKKLAHWEENSLEKMRQALAQDEELRNILGSDFSAEMDHFISLNNESYSVSFSLDVAYAGYLKEVKEYSEKRKYRRATTTNVKGKFKFQAGKYPASMSEYEVFMRIAVNEHENGESIIYTPLSFGMTTGYKFLSIVPVVLDFLKKEEETLQKLADEWNRDLEIQAEAQEVERKTDEIRRARNIIKKYGKEAVLGKE